MANKDFYDTLAYTNRQIDFVSNLKDAKKYTICDNISNVCGYISSGIPHKSYSPKKIIYSGNKTIVIWEDGIKTIVSLAEGDKYDPYLAFCAALAKKVYGSTSSAKRIIYKKASMENITQIPIDAKMKIDDISKKIRDITEALNKAWRVDENE